MNAKKFSDAMSELDTKYIDEALSYKKKAKMSIWVKWGAIAACLCLMMPLTAFAIDIIQYNAAVDYLNSLGIAVEDLSDYSHKEIKEAVKTIDAGESSPLTEEIRSLISENKEPIDTPTQVTSEQIKQLTPTMTRTDILSLLGNTQDIGSGIYIYLYEVDQCERCNNLPTGIPIQKQLPRKYHNTNRSPVLPVPSLQQSVPPLKTTVQSS